MAFVRAQLNCLKGGLTQSIKLSEIVWKLQKPYGLQTFASFLCGGTHLSQYCCLRGVGPAPLWLVPSGNAAHLSPLFMLYAQNYGPVPRNKKSLYKGPEKLAQNFVFLWLPHPFFSSPPSAPDLCFSHKFFATNGETRLRVKKPRYAFRA